MIGSRTRHLLALRAFDAAFLPWMRRRVRAVHLAGLPAVLPPDRPLLLVANHVSWWDGFILRAVQRRLRPAAPLHFVMLEHELASRPLLRVLGGVGIRPGSAPSVARAVALLAQRTRRTPDSVILFFPQGRIFPSHRRPLGFHGGIELLARRLEGAVVLPAGIHLEPLATPAASAFVSLGEPVPSGEAGAPALEEAVERELDAVLAFLSEHGENAPAAWPRPEERLPRPAGALR